MTTAPSAHLREAQKLTAEPLIDLFEIQLRNVPSPTFARFRDGPPGSSTIYLGLEYEHLPTKITGVSQTAEGSKSRPSLTVFNPLGVFNSFAKNGNFDSALIIRRRVLKIHLEQNTNLYQTNMWFVGRVTQVISNQGITLELRTLSDGPDQQIPVRKYMPDTGFTFVTIN